MSEQRTTDVIDPNRWPLISTLLSMDVVAPFHEMIGLRSREPGALRDVLRKHILQVRREFVVDSARGAQAYSPERMFDDVERAMGTAQRNHLLWWGQHIFNWDIQEHRVLRSWGDVMRFCRKDVERWRQLGLPVQLVEVTRSELDRTNDRTLYDKLCLEVYGRPLSDWDLHMYAINLFDDEDDIAPTGPRSYMYPTHKNYVGYRFWAWLLKQMTPQEIGALRRNATSLARQFEELAHVGELPPPALLEIDP